MPRADQGAERLRRVNAMLSEVTATPSDLQIDLPYLRASSIVLAKSALPIQLLRLCLRCPVFQSRIFDCSRKVRSSNSASSIVLAKSALPIQHHRLCLQSPPFQFSIIDYACKVRSSHTTSSFRLAKPTNQLQSCC